MAITIENSNTTNNGNGTTTVTINSSDGTTRTFTEGCSTDGVSSALEIALGVLGVYAVSETAGGIASGLSNVLKTWEGDVTLNLSEGSGLSESWTNNFFQKLSTKPQISTAEEILDEG